MSTQAPDQLTQAKKLAVNAQRKAKKVAADQAVNRSTRTRNALKIKADALDQVASVLASKA